MSPGDRLGADVWAAALHDRPAVCPSVRPVVGWLASHARPSTCWSSRLCPAAGRRAAAAAAALVDRTACRRRRHLRAFYHNERVYRRLPPPPRRPGPLPGPPTAATVHMEASSPDLPIALLAHTHTHTHTRPRLHTFVFRNRLAVQPRCLSPCRVWHSVRWPCLSASKYCPMFCENESPILVLLSVSTYRRVRWTEFLERARHANSSWINCSLFTVMANWCVNKLSQTVQNAEN